LEMPDLQKLELNEYLAEVDFRISEGASSNIQLTAFLAKLVKENESRVS